MPVGFFLLEAAAAAEPCRESGRGGIDSIFIFSLLFSPLFSFPLCSALLDVVVSSPALGGVFYRTPASIFHFYAHSH